MAKILILTLHRRDRAPGQRFRHEQYLSFLEEHGHQIKYSNLLSAKQDKVFYGHGQLLRKALIGVSALLKRFKDLLSSSRYDYILIYRDAFFFGVFYEKLFSFSRAKLVFDFDDSIWLQDKNPNQSFFQRLKNPAKTGKIISHCDLIIAGNEYLADYARIFNSNVKIIPTTIDLNEYQFEKKERDQEVVCIGWSGSFSTIKHFESAIEPLTIIKDEFKNQVKIKVIGDGNYKNDSLDIVGLPWKKESEISDLGEIDIGIMPLPDDKWSKGKCGLKGLQYMALGIPTIMSPVGVNKDIIQEGKNGMLATSTEEWVEKLTLLIEDEKLRERIGVAGRKTVEKDFSVEANKNKWLKVFSKEGLNQ